MNSSSGTAPTRRTAAARLAQTRPGSRTASRPGAMPGPTRGPSPGPRSRLTVVPDRRAAPRRTFVVLLIGVLGAGLIGLLVLNTAMQRAAFALDGLNDRAEALDVRRQVLDLEVDRLRSPQVLGRRATALGMVPMTTPVFLRLSDGEILGSPQTAVAGVGPQLIPPPPVPDADTSGRPRPQAPGPQAPGPQAAPDRQQHQQPRQGEQ